MKFSFGRYFVARERCETQTRLSRHNKFISAENISILSVSSDDYLHASLSLQSSKCGVTDWIFKIYIYIYIYTNFKSKRYTQQRLRRSSSYKVVMYIHKLNHFCNTFSPDDGPKSGRKYLGNKQLWKIYQTIPTEYYKISTAI